MSRNAENQFVVDLLTTLRGERFSPRAWIQFLQDSWIMSRRTARENPALKRSWHRVTCLVALLALALLAGNMIFEGKAAILRLLPGFVFCVAWQQSDLFWHLGLNREMRSGKLFPTVGSANTLTRLRGLCASYLIGRIAGGLLTPSWLALTVYLCGLATDILDGQIARRTRTESKLGRIADGEADFCLFLSLMIILMQNNMLSPWIALVMLLRFTIPLAAVLVSYFAFARPVHFGSTIWGKWAGFAQSLYFLALLAPPRLHALAHVINTPLLVGTVILLCIAPLAQIAANSSFYG